MDELRDRKHLIEWMTVSEVRAAMRRTKTIILPIGVVEQHGYHLPLNIDTYVGYVIARRAAVKAGCLVAPPLNYGYSGGELPGTINVSPQVVSLMIMEILESLSIQGFKTIIVHSWHGGTEHMQGVADACDMFQRRNPDKKDVTISLVMWKFIKNWSKHFKPLVETGDFHAGKYETSLGLAVYPEEIRHTYKIDSEGIATMLLTDQDAYQLKIKNVDSEYVVPKIRQHPKINVGVFGNPKGASAKIGNEILDEFVENFALLIKEVEGKKPAKKVQKKSNK